MLEPRMFVYSRRIRRLAPLLTLLLALAALSPAARTTPIAHADDSPFAVPTSLDGSGRATTAVALGDLNGDGALDLVLGNSFDINQVYLNKGAGGFAVPTELPGSGYTVDVALGDLNGDGALDLVLGSLVSASQVYLNNRAGGFAAPVDLPDSGRETHAVALGDLNGDGALDLVLGNSSGPSQVYLNDRAGGFAALPALVGSGAYTSDVAVGDLNGDGALDLVLGNNGSASQVYLNNRAGGFAAPVDLPDSGRDTNAVALGDLNGDGALDLVLGNGASASQVYLNNGAGDFAVPIELRLPGRNTQAIALGDLNGDGALDLVLGNPARASQVYLNKGAGDFAVPTDLPGSDWAFDVALGDLNGDGALDLVLGNYVRTSQVYLNKGAGGFAVPTDLPGSSRGTSAVALGDLNGDGALDIVLGNNGIWSGNQILPQPSQVYLNNRAGGFAAPVDLPGSDRETYAVALGDLNGDGALDIVLGNNRIWSGNQILPQPSQVYLNNGVGGFAAPVDLPGSNGGTYAVALGDLNGDGALDIVLGNSGSRVFYSVLQPSLVYLNNGAGGFAVPIELPGNGFAFDVALGDLNGDGALDLVLGNSDSPSQVYLNNRAGGFAAPVDLPGSAFTVDVALGDLNGDSALDLVLSDSFGINHVYLNKGAGGFAVPIDLLGGGRDTNAIALGDLNGDGALDLVLGAGKVYLNNRAGGFAVPIDLLGGGSIALGDLNGDGALDLVLGNYSASQVYFNLAANNAHMPNNPPAVTVARPGPTANAGFYSTPAILSDPIIPISYRLTDPEGDPVRAISATFSLDGGGSWQTAVATADTSTKDLATSLPELFTSASTMPITITDNDVTTASLFVPGAQPLADLDVTLTISHTHDADLDVALVAPDGTTVPLFSAVGGAGQNFTNTILDGAATTAIGAGSAPFSGSYRPIGSLAALNGKSSYGLWRLRVADTAAGNTGTIISWGIRLRTAQVNAGAHIFKWDTFKSGIFGQSDNVVFRIAAYPSLRPQRNGVAGPYQHPYAASVTFPFRVRGTQVRVVGAGVPTNPLAPIVNQKPRIYLPLARADSSGASAVTNLGAEVYRIHGGQPGALLADPSGRPFRSDLQGYLGGRGELAVGDQLVALQPIAATATYTVYNTSAAPTLTGLNAFTVRSSGVQTLTVSTANPLVLFNLKVSLEWDARADPQFLSQLGFDLRRVSELLYDWSNGQAALGDVTVYHAKQRWADADIRIYATNRLRPNADPGGIGQADKRIRMGAVWTRYGDAGGTLGEDWPRALAHEIGHYALGLDDNYLGLDALGRLIPIESCLGVMSDPYREEQSEFHAHADWLPGCQSTLANQESGRADWENIVRAFPWLKQPDAPSFAPANAGPNNLPLAVTQVRFVGSITPTAALDAPIFYLTQGGARVLPGSSARGFLLMCADGQVVAGVCQNDQWRDVVDLGQPTLDQVLARGARAGDRLCVYELAVDRLGCETIRVGDTGLALIATSGWRPEVTITPNSTQSVRVQVGNIPAGLELKARLYPADGAASAIQTLTSAGGQYQATFTLAQPSLAGYVHVWANEADPRREVIADYGLGGSGAKLSKFGAPVLSPDGQVLLYTPGQTLPAGQFYTLQATTRFATPPAWATVIGQAYRLTTTGGASLAGSSLNFSYLGRDVPPGEDQWVTVYYCPLTCPDDSSGWQALPTSRDTTLNQAIAATQGPGLYALMSSVEIPLTAGVNIVAYPVHTSRTVAAALKSLAGVYTLVRGYDSATHRWRALGPNDLLAFGKGYEITVLRAVTWRLKGDGVAAAASVASVTAEALPAPAIYSGIVQGDASWAPAAGLPVVARVNGQPCGQGGTLADGQRVVYMVYVAAEAGLPGCGVPGRSVTFAVGDQPLGTAAWDNRQKVEVTLRR